MSGETEKDVSGWTTDTLRQDLLARIAALHEVTDNRFEAIHEAVEKKETATEKRFDSVNEFRGQLKDQATLFMPRSEYQALHSSLENKVDLIAERLTRIEGVAVGGDRRRSEGVSNVTLLLSVMGLVFVAVGIVVTVILAHH